MSRAADAAGALAKVLRDEWGRLVASLARITGDASLAEDCVQEAFARAWETWPRGGSPDRPAAWVARVARNRALDVWRRARREESKLRLIEEMPEDRDPDNDALLALVFTCAHPALPVDGQVALTLRWVAGLSTGEIARAFLVTEETMTRRLTRARTKVRTAAIPLEVPADPWMPDRLQGVLGVLYLLFNHGNDAGPTDTVRATTATEAVRLARLLTTLMPKESEPCGLLALLLLTQARRPARHDPQGRLVTLEHQDRTLWDRALTEEGLVWLGRALVAGSPGPYTLQGAIASCHAQAPTAVQTDFRAIAQLYARLETLVPTPVVRLNRAVALGLAEGPGVGLALVEQLSGEPTLAGYPYYHASRASFLDDLGRRSEAELAWARAEALAVGEAQKQYLAARRSGGLKGP